MTAGYGVNYFLPPTSTKEADGTLNARTLTYPDMTQLSRPESVPLVADGRYPAWLGTSGDLNQAEKKKFYRFDRIRHSKGANLVCCDGHVS
ncbi:hypothetical protein BVY04_02540 [bacterium M21]|nr:hypothetical protein BVY04_02540 [bacterium M21]